jgi:phosphatidylinositol alpha-1,6-mannosyltransferase
MGSRGVPQRVLFIISEVFAAGGIQRFNQTILDACARLGIVCRVLSLHDSAASIVKQPQRDDFPVVGFSGNRRRFAFAVARALIWDHYDRAVIGHINFLALVISVLALNPFRRPQTVLIAHGIEVWSGIGRVRRCTVASTDLVLCVSRYTRQRILEQAPALLPTRLVLFPNALADTWRSVAPAFSNRTLPGRFILSVTRMERGDRYKGIATVIEALSMLADDSLQYFVVGHGNDRSFLQLVARRFDVADRVHFLRGLSDSELIDLYRNCEAFVLPSGNEGFGIVYLEAMLFGAPVIAASEKGAMDVVRDGDTGLSVSFGDTIAIKVAIERLMSDSVLRDRLRANGRSLVEGGGPYTFASFTRRLAEIFDVTYTIAA